MKDFDLKIFGKSFLSLERRSEISSIKNPKEWLARVLGNDSFSGVSVTQDTALTFSAVYACVRIIANSLAMVPLNVHNEDNNGNKSISKKHAAHFLIHSEPNQLMTSYAWRQAMQAQVLLKGNSYSIIIRDAGYRPVEFRLIAEPNDVEPFIFQNKLWYKIHGQNRPLSADDVLHIKGLGFDGIKGKSVLTVARESIGTSLAMQQYGGNVFQTGGAKRVALKHPGKVDPDIRDRLKGDFKKKYGTPDNLNEIAFLEAGLDVVEIGMNPEDAQFIASREFSVEEIARYYGMALHLIAHQKRPTYASVEQQAIEFVTYCLNPWYCTWESELNRRIFKTTEKLNYYTKFNLSALLRGDAKARSQFYKDMFYIGAFNRNEIRALEDKNKIKNGDTYFIQSNMAPAEQIGDILKLKYNKNGTDKEKQPVSQNN